MAEMLSNPPSPGGSPTSPATKPGYNPEKLSTKTKLLLASGEAVQGAWTTVAGFFLNAFFLETCCLSPQQVGFIQLIQGSFDAANDPCIGYLSDRTRCYGRKSFIKGRRRPWLFYAAPFLAVVHSALWWPLDVTTTTSTQRFWYYLLCYMGVSIGISCIQLQIVTLCPELSEDYSERVELNGLRLAAVVIFGFLIAIVRQAIIYTEVFGGGENGGIRASGIVLSIFMLLVAWNIVFNIKEKFAPNQESKEELSFYKSFYENLLCNKAFWCCVGTFVCGPTAIVLVQANVAMFCKYALKDESIVNIVLGSVQATAIFAMFGWAKLVSGPLKKKKREKALGGGSKSAIANDPDNLFHTTGDQRAAEVDEDNHVVGAIEIEDVEPKIFSSSLAAENTSSGLNEIDLGEKQLRDDHQFPNGLDDDEQLAEKAIPDGENKNYPQGGKAVAEEDLQHQEPQSRAAAAAMKITALSSDFADYVTSTTTYAGSYVKSVKFPYVPLLQQTSEQILGVDWDKRHMLLIGGPILAGALIMVSFFDENTPTLAIIFTCLVVGMMLPVVYLTPYSLLPDLIEDDEIRTGRRREGVYAGFSNVSLKLSISVALAGTNGLLESAGYQPPATSCGGTGISANPADIADGTSVDGDYQPQAVVDILRFLMGPAPAICIFFATIFAYSFPISKRKATQNVKKARKSRMENLERQAQEDKLTEVDKQALMTLKLEGQLAANDEEEEKTTLEFRAESLENNSSSSNSGDVGIMPMGNENDMIMQGFGSHQTGGGLIINDSSGEATTTMMEMNTTPPTVFAVRKRSKDINSKENLDFSAAARGDFGEDAAGTDGTVPDAF
ncbi:unnamed protein product [Amoebophrya sp. A120]|nr:unnamed protein product [Amoebophrya sp. A120]|eukprot:GSA120T00024500001.1